MPWVARQRLRIGDGFREPGEPVPEADSWTNVEAWERTGHIAWVAELPNQASSEPEEEVGVVGEDPPAPRRSASPKRKPAAKKPAAKSTATKRKG